MQLSASSLQRIISAAELTVIMMIQTQCGACQHPKSQALLGDAASKHHSKQTCPYCVRSVLHMMCFDDDPVSTASNSNRGSENATHYIVIYSFKCCLQVRCPLQSSKSTLQTIVCNQAAAICSQTAALVCQLHAPAHTNKVLTLLVPDPFLVRTAAITAPWSHTHKLSRHLSLDAH